MVEFQLLGPVTVRYAGRETDVGSPNRRAVLAMLLMEPRRIVPVDQIISVVWGNDPPVQARAVLQGHIHALRCVLANAGAADPPAATILTRGPGYALVVRNAQVDAYLFGQLLDAARESDDDVERLAVLDAALALWRGPALADVAVPALAQVARARWDEGRLRALELRAAALLRLGRSSDVTAQAARRTGPGASGLVRSTLEGGWR